MSWRTSRRTCFAGAVGSGGDAAIGGMAGLGGGDATGGSSGSGGTGACRAIDFGTPRCGPASTCDGTELVHFQYCNVQACSGPSTEWKRTACPDGTACGGGKCLTHVSPPAKTCSIATDCGLPSTVCVGASKQLIFSDPSCDDGQCHWKEIVNLCGAAFIAWECLAGTCSDPGALTRGPYPPMPSPDPMQPAAAPEQACTTTADCTQPQPGCFQDSVVSYVNGVCRTGSCRWELDLSQCPGTCSGGVCVAP